MRVAGNEAYGAYKFAFQEEGVGVDDKFLYVYCNATEHFIIPISIIKTKIYALPEAQIILQNIRLHLFSPSRAWYPD